MRNRGSTVIIEDQKVLLIKRVREDDIYYVFLGGGIEVGETPEIAAKREAFEELGVIVNIKELFSKMELNGTQYFFLAEINGGSVGTGTGEEFIDENKDRGTYEPLWIHKNELLSLNVKPKEVAEKIFRQLYK